MTKKHDGTGVAISGHIGRKAGRTYLHSQERIDGVLYLVVETRDEHGIRQKQYTRADLVKG